MTYDVLAVDDVHERSDEHEFVQLSDRDEVAA